ncbi:UNKNOWN [Stylonychia lemnae]|uniref:Uncharacterized protein n=1 Tax=Stylonychia lemnae TaxID=5949 RepID=A0A078B3M2_STYLE|nr:UNKNOWN [Stylonychia lemnae]|eukprot:CDW88103.1 UNKNOWN [Stylonychia lemnae]
MKTETTQDDFAQDSNQQTNSSNQSTNEGSRSVLEVIKKAGEIPQILSETLNLLPSKEVLKEEVKLRFKEENKDKKLSEKDFQRDLNEREQRRTTIMNFLTSFSALSKNFLDSTNDLVTKTNLMKEKIIQLIQFCDAISWNRNTLQHFQKEIKALSEECQQAIRVQRALLDKQRNEKVVEENIKNSVNLFSGSEYLNEIFENIKNLENLIPIQKQKIEREKDMIREQSRENYYAYNTQKNQISKQEQKIQKEKDELAKIEKEIVQLKSKKGEYISNDLIDIVEEQKRLVEQIKDIEEKKIVSVSKDITGYYDEQRQSYRIEIGRIHNQLNFLKEEKKIKKQKILGMFPDNSEYSKQKKILLLQQLDYEKKIKDTFQNELQDINKEISDLESQLKDMKKMLKIKNNEFLKQQNCLRVGPKYQNLKDKKIKLKAQLKDMRNQIKDSEDKLSLMESELDNKAYEDKIQNEGQNKNIESMENTLRNLEKNLEDWYVKKKNQEQDRIQIVQLIRLVRNLNQVAHYLTLLQSANTFIIDILVRLANQLSFMLEAIEQINSFKSIQKGKIQKKQLELMMESYSGKNALIQELELNIKCLQDPDSAKHKQKFYERLTHESLDILNQKLCQPPKEVQKMFPEVPADLLNILKNQVNIYFLKKLKRNNTSEFSVGGSTNTNQQNSSNGSNDDIDSLGSFANNNKVDETQQESKNKELIDKYEIIKIQIRQLKELIIMIFDSQSSRVELMRQDILQRDKAILNGQSGGNPQNPAGPNIIIMQQQRIFEIDGNQELLD